MRRPQLSPLGMRAQGRRPVVRDTRVYTLSKYTNVAKFRCEAMKTRYGCLYAVAKTSPLRWTRRAFDYRRWIQRRRFPPLPGQATVHDRRYYRTCCNTIRTDAGGDSLGHIFCRTLTACSCFFCALTVTRSDASRDSSYCTRPTPTSTQRRFSPRGVYCTGLRQNGTLPI